MMSDSTPVLDELAKCVGRRLFYAYKRPGKKTEILAVYE
jgi:hypothetical protein